MAGYCRYCGKKMTDLRDPFCYSCRNPGEPVDFFYRFAKKVDLDEDDKDRIRDGGKELIAMALVGAVFPAFLLPFFLLLNATNPIEKDRAPDWAIVTMIVILVILLIYLIVGIGLMRLEKRFVDRKWKIAGIMFFFGLFRSNRGGAAIISAALTHKKKKEQENRLAIALTRLATGEKPVRKTAAPAQPLPGWKCRFCGYRNPQSRMDCKSCGKVK